MISVDWTLFLQMAQFIVLLLIMNAVLYRPLRAMMEQRREKIDGAQSRAKGLEAQIQEKMARYQEQLDQAKHKAGAERLQMKSEAAKQEAEIVEAARNMAATQVEGVKKQVGQDADSARVSLKADIEAMASMVAGKVLGRSL